MSALIMRAKTFTERTLTCSGYSIIGNSFMLLFPSPLGANCFRTAAYLTAIVTTHIKLLEHSCMIPTLPIDKFSKAAPRIFPGSVKELSYSPSGVTSAVLFKRLSLGIRKFLNIINLQEEIIEFGLLV